MKIIGIDEAGRGPVLGPMILAALAMEKEKENLLFDYGIQDSKKLRPKKRKEIFQILQELDEVEIHYNLFTPQEIDKTSLTDLYRQGVLELCHTIKGDEVYLDLPCPPKSIPPYLQWFQSQLPHYKVIGKNRGEDHFPIVAAASIVAKVIRDEEMEKLKKIWGDLGSGYPSDPKTRKFLQNWIQKGKALPPFVRTKWNTLNILRQQTLF